MRQIPPLPGTSPPPEPLPAPPVPSTAPLLNVPWLPELVLATALLVAAGAFMWFLGRADEFAVGFIRRRYQRQGRDPPL